MKHLALLKLIVLVVVLFSGSSLTASSIRSGAQNIPGASELVAGHVVSKLNENLPAAGKSRIAVLAFGDKNRKYTTQMGSLGMQLQGEIIETLKTRIGNNNSVSTKFSVASYEFLSETFTHTSNDPGGLSDKNIELARKVLFAEGFEVGIVGHFGFDGASISKESLGPNVKCYFTAIFKTQKFEFSFELKTSEVLLHVTTTPKKPSGDLTKPGPISNATNPNVASRFKVEFFGQPRGQSQYEKIPLHIVTDGPLTNTLVLPVDENRFKGRPYFVRVTNKADNLISVLGAADHKNSVQTRHRIQTSLSDSGQVLSDLEKSRMFLMAGFIDGVSIFKRKTKKSGVVAYEKDIRSYSHTQKYVLTGPTYQLRSKPGYDDKDRLNNAVLVHHPQWTRDQDHSQVDIKGFLKPAGGNSHSGQFVFGDARQSVGQEFVGTGVSQIGIVSLFFFAEKLKDDKKVTMTRTEVGATIEGKDIPTPTFSVSVKNIYKVPVETWQIAYYYIGSGSGGSSNPKSIPIVQN